MRFYLEYINHLGRLQKKSAHRRLQAGFTITEVLLAGLMMLIAVLVAGIGLINLLRSNYRANADSEIRNNLNRTLEFVSDEVRRARIIANSETAITSTKVPTGEKAVLAFQIPDPNNPSLAPLNEQIVYYTTGPKDSLTGPRVLWRYGPNLDPNGNYTTPDDILTWQHSPVTDRLAEDAVNPSCPADFNKISNPISNPPQGFFACVHKHGNQVILNADAQIKMTTNDEVKYSVNTRVFTRACQIYCLTSSTPTTTPTPPFYRTPGSGATTPTLPIVTVPATVTAQVIKGGTCTFSSSCGVVTAPDEDLPGIPEGALGSPVLANAGDGIVVFVDGLRNVYENTQAQTVEVYTSDSNNLPANSNSLTQNQILLVFTTKTTPPNSYEILVTITPQ
jgi:type II secretory pathway component PulJ